MGSRTKRKRETRWQLNRKIQKVEDYADWCERRMIAEKERCDSFAASFEQRDRESARTIRDLKDKVRRAVAFCDLEKTATDTRIIGVNFIIQERELYMQREPDRVAMARRIAEQIVSELNEKYPPQGMAFTRNDLNSAHSALNRGSGTGPRGDKARNRPFGF